VNLTSTGGGRSYTATRAPGLGGDIESGRSSRTFHGRRRCGSSQFVQPAWSGSRRARRLEGRRRQIGGANGFVGLPERYWPWSAYWRGDPAIALSNLAITLRTGEGLVGDLHAVGCI